MRLLAIDPGPEESALLIYDTTTKLPVEWDKLENWEAMNRMEGVWLTGVKVLYVEMIASYGMAVGAETFETCVWIGRFLEKWRRYGSNEHRVYRREVKLHLCDDSRAKDANVRQALIDRYGGKEKAIGRKASPGPLYGLTGDCWAALAVAITAAER